MAIAKPGWSYWSCPFIRNLLNPIGAGGVFMVSNLLITSMLLPRTQGVACDVCNTISQTGKCVDIALTALVTNEVTRNSGILDISPEALLKGYRAAFLFCVSLVATSLFVSA